MAGLKGVQQAERKRGRWAGGCASVRRFSFMGVPMLIVSLSLVLFLVLLFTAVSSLELIFAGLQDKQGVCNICVWDVWEF